MSANNDRNFEDVADQFETWRAVDAVTDAVATAEGDKRRPIERLFAAALRWRAGVLDDQAFLDELGSIGMAFGWYCFCRGLDVAKRRAASASSSPPAAD